MPWTEARLEADSPAVGLGSPGSAEINEARSSRSPSESLNCLVFGPRTAVW